VERVVSDAAETNLRGHAQRDRRRIIRNIVAAVLGYTLMVVLLFVWTLAQLDAETFALAQKEARANFDKDQAFRAWGTSHGGVYVPVTEKTPSSPYMAHIPERDITTPSGKRLTLMNPAYMLRQMMQQYGDLYGVKGRITSLTPLNPDNVPDAWEQAALESFIDESDEVTEITAIDGMPYLRLMKPMMTRSGCLLCHGHQGYEVGNIRGGVGVAVPMKPYLDVVSGRKINTAILLGGVWVFGLTGIGLFGYRGLHRVEERRSYEEQIWAQANYDKLTGLANRNLFMDRMEQALAHAQREGTKLVLLFIDLDRFKNVNDTRGHNFGDALLAEAGQRIKLRMREADTVARLGGDEFTVVLNDLNKVESAALVATKLINAFNDPFDIDGHQVHVSASVGLTVYPDDGADLVTLMKNADSAMYQAKEEGRGRFSFFTQQMNLKAQRRIRLETELRDAVAKAQLHLEYQPLVCLGTGRILGAEALLRWQHPDLGNVAPDEFIPIAEDSGLILPIGDWVLDQAVIALSAWKANDLGLERLSINVSAVQWHSKEFQRRFMQRIKALKLGEGELTIELTESVFLGHETGLEMQMERLRELGLGLSVDDFGTGYSSLSYLKRLPVSEIKIDRSFVRDLLVDPDDETLCKTIISMGHNLGLQVIAEGVESAEQLSYLKELGCDLAQGYHIGRPMTEEVLAQYLEGFPDMRFSI
jgi:diguanylate cyclase (GGDEF)-like protein